MSNEQFAMDILLRVMDKAHKCANQRGTGFEELAEAYERAVMKEIADLTDPIPNTREEER